jgi:N-glycosylase/DNA lyase
VPLSFEIKMNIQYAIEQVYRELSTCRSPSASWQLLEEEELWSEIVACILGSRVSFNVANAAMESLRFSGLLLPEYYIDTSLEHELKLVGALTRAEVRYPFSNLRAQQIRRSAEIIYGNGTSLRCLLRNSYNAYDMRKQLVEKLVGIGPKQSSLFLRNIGYSDEVAVLDTHILKYMSWFNLMPDSLNAIRNLQQYEEVEKVFIRHAYNMGFSLPDFDIAVWVVVRVAKQEFNV